MKKAIRIPVFLVLGFLSAHNPLWAQTKAPQENSLLPDFQLPIPSDMTHHRYLGLEGEGSFKIQQIRAKAVIIEIFSMYCPYCQREAPNINKLYQRMENDPGLRGKIKIIGIGAGNSPFEVDIFRKKYNVPFPLFADNNFTVHKCLGETRTPYFFVVAINPQGSQKVIYSKLGGIKDLDSLLQTIRLRAGIK
ncbi:MAG: TlpA family protein disulfide reductase [Deltaproteobacteria bacterium]|nr:MAG: TlpA family protein disulfide reductase [Deltaproteobacteria bacterium]